MSEKYDERHGGPFDRGCADFYYGRGFTPHYYAGGTYTSDRVDVGDMTKTDLAAYRAGYEYAAEQGETKDWG